MKIAIVGYSGSGKSTMAQKLGAYYQVEVLHLDSVHFLPNWIERPRADMQKMVRDFLNTHPDWVIDGNYTDCDYERRMESADQIIMMLFPPLSSLWRVVRRYLHYRNTSRPDLGCTERLNWEFVKWVLWQGRSKRAQQRYRDLAVKYPEKVVILKTQRQIDIFLQNFYPL